MVEAEEVLLQLRAEYRPEAALSQKRSQLLRAIELTERQHDLIRQKVVALTEMQSKLEERLATFSGWLDQMEATLKSERKTKVKSKA